MGSKKSVSDFEEEDLTQLPNENAELIKNSQWGVRKSNNELGKGEYREFVIDRSISQKEIDTMIDRIADEFQKNESSAESYELGIEEYQNSVGR